MILCFLDRMLWIFKGRISLAEALSKVPGNLMLCVSGYIRYF